MQAQRWWTGLTKYQWIVLLVAWMGWVFDIADTALFNFAKGPMLAELLPRAQTGYVQAVDGRLLTVFLIGWALGGLVFGILADKWGRTRTMVFTILLYAVFTGLTALCHSWQQVAVVRFVTALGIGGEWAAGAALIAEVFPDKARAPAAGFLQSAAAFGPVFAALANYGIAPEHWRWLFLVGIVPAFVCVAIRMWIKEPEHRTTAEKTTRGDMRELFSDPLLRRNAIVALVLGVVVIAGAANVSYWLPNLVEQSSKGLSAAIIQDRKSEVTIVMHIGTLIGVLLMPWVCEKIGRRPALATFMVLSPVSVWLATMASGSYEGLRLAAPLMSLFSIGISAGLVLYFPELFPSRLRATGSGIAYNVSRVIAALFPIMTAAMMGVEHSVAKGVAATAIVLGLGVVVLFFAIETRGKPLAA
ncbi:MAG TPA: MFS transporter [Fimbriimonadaceae bacterium]|nr:MFS transporter [Fimbriimonadaceae bacterium]